MSQVLSLSPMSRFLYLRKTRVPRRDAPALAGTADSRNAEAAGDAHGDGFAGMPQATSAWIGALGITAGLAAAGFIGKLALQQFLGIELANWTALDLSIFAGQWAIETLRIILQGVLDHPFSWGIPILLYLTPTLISFTFPLHDKRGQIAARASITLAAIGLCYALVWCEMPTLSLNNWLTKKITLQLDEPDSGILSSREADMKATLLVSKMDGIALVIPSQPPGGAPSLEVCGLSGDHIPGRLRAHLRTDLPATAATSELHAIYAACVIICLTSLIALYLHQVVEKPHLLDDAFRALRLFASFVLLPLVACLIPYMYGKLIYPSEFPSVTVTFKSEDADKSTPSSQEPPSTQRMLILDETDKDLSLLNTHVNFPYQVEIRDRSQIMYILRYEKEDVLNTILRNTDWMPDALTHRLAGHPCIAP
jgi:hypothetical protein